MAQWDSFLKRIEKRIVSLEAKTVQQQIPQALKQYAETTQMPRNKGLRNQVRRIQDTVKLMIGTLPGGRHLISGEPPTPPRKTTSLKKQNHNQGED